jgi:putative ABC transport system permease protein
VGDGRPGTVVVVNAVLAQHHFGSPVEAVGRRIELGGEGFEVVGVVGDVRQAGLDQLPLAEIHFPFDRGDLGGLYMNSASLVVRHSADPSALLSEVRRIVRALDADAVVHEMAPMGEVIAGSVWRRRLAALLLGAVAALSTVLAVAGVYGLMTYMTESRRREFGVRLAIGARPGDIVLLVLRHAALLTLAGLTIGLPLAFFTSRLLTDHLYEVRANDPLTGLIAVAILVGVSIVSALVPGLTASRVQPATAIRSD